MRVINLVFACLLGKLTNECVCVKGAVAKSQAPALYRTSMQTEHGYWTTLSVSVSLLRHLRVVDCSRNSCHGDASGQTGNETGPRGQACSGSNQTSIRTPSINTQLENQLGAQGRYAGLKFTNLYYRSFLF